MNRTTRERLLDASTRLFAESGYRGASVRDICNQARANPGAVSYHFGGKRQLYRAVLRRAASHLVQVEETVRPHVEGEDPPVGAAEALGRISSRLTGDDTATRLLLRDLADGGTVAVESLTPLLRSSYEQLAISIGEGDRPRSSAKARLLFLELAAPIFLLTAGWPVVSRALDLDDDHRDGLLDELIDRALREKDHAALDPATVTTPRG
jgi:AcrR family transcriptional regulator